VSDYPPSCVAGSLPRYGDKGATEHAIATLLLAAATGPSSAAIRAADGGSVAQLYHFLQTVPGGTVRLVS